MSDEAVPAETRAYIEQYFANVQNPNLPKEEFTKQTEEMHKRRAADPLVDLAYWEYEASHGNQNAVAKVQQIRYDLSTKST